MGIEMCGIVGISSVNDFSINELIVSLKRLEYRGYDSFGYVDNTGKSGKFVGEIKDSEGKIENFKTKTAISHTRWATHGGVCEANSHPHADCNGRLFIVHNGIIENYLELKARLSGHKFVSDTDSEVIAHYFEEKLKSMSIEEAIMGFFSEAVGTYAIIIMKKGSDKIYALKKDSPLVLGIDKGSNIIASDIYAFSDRTNKAIFFDDYEFAVVDAQSYQFFDKNGKKMEKNVQEFTWPEESDTKNFDHYMIKEIKEEPFVAERMLTSLRTTQKDKLEKLLSLIKSSHKVMFVAAGTSYHASLLGVYFLHKVGIETNTLIASEFEDYANIDDKTLVVAISQSGETMDVIDALKIAKQKGAKIASIVNVPYSTVQRMSDLSIDILAGQEVCVASTKTFVNQVVVFFYLAREFGMDIKLEKLPEEIRAVIAQEDRIKQIAHTLVNNKDIYVIGRGLSYPVAREVALKLKEISYIHAEGMMGGELKHGTLALIEKNTPVIAIINGNPNVISNVKEIEARGAKIIAITYNGSVNYSDQIKIETEHDGSFAILATVVGQLLTYHIAKEKGLPIDKPRNLAKSVTVK
jgi:glucosamine--fructose-6-phosphate aminotransferase (isomerizing)